jgi:hypothetical protein
MTPTQPKDQALEKWSNKQYQEMKEQIDIGNELLASANKEIEELKDKLLIEEQIRADDE